MKHACAALVALGSIVFLQSQPLAAQEDEAVEPQRVIVKWRASGSFGAQSPELVAAVDNAAALIGIAVKSQRVLATGGELLEIDSSLAKTDLERFTREIEKSGRAEYIHEDSTSLLEWAPNDPRYNEQWHYFENTASIRAPGAWNVANGNRIVVAVIDSGFTDHPDLLPNILPGYDFITSPAAADDGDGRDNDAHDPGPGQTRLPCAPEPLWHGTHIAGTIGAVTNNSTGVAGVAFGARILPVRTHGGCGGIGVLSDIVEAIKWAAGGTVSGVPQNANPAKVLNLSFGVAGSSCPAEMQSAINYARSRGAVVVTSAGNDNESAATHAPSNCSGVLSVGAVNRAGARAGYSNFGTGVDVMAPGGDGAGQVLSTGNAGLRAPGGHTYTNKSGTSMAAAHASGVVALVLSKTPALSPDEVERRVVGTAKWIPPSVCTVCARGIINATVLLTLDPARTPGPPTSIAATRPTSSGSFTLSWGANPEATHYFVERRLVGGTWRDLARIDGSSAARIAHLFSSTQAGTWQTRVQSCNLLHGCSLFANGPQVTVCPGGTCQ